ncbi:hypothetical protein BJ742DRAFT_779922 [Cladochytrium replicatum]|nr:hypothetical protein BJ742DRAFT_779922 [Cladochytrium replicatum]
MVGLSNKNRLEKVYHECEPILRDIFRIAFRKNTGQKWVTPRSKNAHEQMLSRILQNSQSSKGRPNSRFISKPLEEWDISAFNKLSYTTSLFDTREAEAIRRLTKIRNECAHAPSGIIPKSKFKNLMRSVKALRDDDVLRELLESRRFALNGTAVMSKKGTAKSMGTNALLSKSITVVRRNKNFPKSVIASLIPPRRVILGTFVGGRKYLKVDETSHPRLFAKPMRKR